MPVKNRVIYDIERCVCKVPDACTDCSKRREGLVPLECMEELMKDALELLKEQEAVKPLKSKLSFTHGFDWEIWDCGCCGNQLRSFAKYCDQCGKAVKWDE